MQDSRTKPSSSRPDARKGSRPGSSRPPRAITRLQEALANAERMARRVDRVLEEDSFAAALLAREYLSMIQELDVNPLDQQGRTDAWTSAFVRLRVASNTLDRDARRADGEAYLAARAEERRLSTMFGSAPRAQLTAVRAESRSKRAQSRGFVVGAWLSMAGGIIALAIALALGHAWVAVLAGLAGALATAGLFLAASFAARASARSTVRALELEQGISGLSVFQTSDRGRALIERIQREHPLLVRTSLGEGSSNPPPPTSMHDDLSRK